MLLTMVMNADHVLTTFLMRAEHGGWWRMLMTLVLLLMTLIVDTDQSGDECFDVGGKS